MKRSVSVHISEFVCQAVAGEDPDVNRVSEVVGRAIRYYVDSGESGGPGWPYPGFRQDDSEVNGGVDVQVSIDEELWRSLEEEAARQGVSTQQLAVHATLWFAAELDAGRATQRILEGLDETPD